MCWTGWRGGVSLFCFGFWWVFFFGFLCFSFIFDGFQFFYDHNNLLIFFSSHFKYYCHNNNKKLKAGKCLQNWPFCVQLCKGAVQ